MQRCLHSHAEMSALSCRDVCTLMQHEGRGLTPQTF
nr:MAG TPA: hypothetical protein [Caudoviricetes sp.]